MATKVITFLIDDIDGSTADATVSFQIDGEDYEIDLSTANTAALRKLLAPYMAAGRKAGREAGRKSRRTVPKDQLRARGAEDPSSIREWAQRNGHPTGKRGRLPEEIIEAHQRATA
jgi:hypothetical protein